jgi:thiamine-phosphate pyrophosphorylase
VAWLAGADGVHVGTGDLPIAEARQVAPGLAVGASSHNRSEVEQTLAQSPDYLAFGPVFGTRSKADAAPVVGLEGLAWAAQQAGGRPLVAIGGICLENAAAVRDAGAHAAAVISALMVEDRQVTAVARALHVELGGRGWTR